MKYIRTLKQVNPTDYETAGSIACDLSLFSRNNVSVPLMFVITSGFVLDLLKLSGVKNKIDFLISRLDYNKPQSLVNVYHTARKLIGEIQFPQDFEEELREICDSLSTDLDGSQNNPHFMVILSPNYEVDPENNEGIVQNIIGFDELTLAIKECIAMLYTPDALYFRRRNNIPEDRLYPAVIVESMIYPKASITAYSSLEEEFNNIKVYSYRGNLDIRNTIKKDVFIVSKDFINVVKHNIVLQDKIIMQEEDERLYEKDFFEGEGQSVNDKVIMDVARHVKKSEKVLGMAVKQYYALKGDGKLYLILSKRLPFNLSQYLRQEGEHIINKREHTGELHNVIIPISQDVELELSKDNEDVEVVQSSNNHEDIKSVEEIAEEESQGINEGSNTEEQEEPEQYFEEENTIHDENPEETYNEEDRGEDEAVEEPDRISEEREEEQEHTVYEEVEGHDENETEKEEYETYGEPDESTEGTERTGSEDDEEQKNIISGESVIEENQKIVGKSIHLIQNRVAGLVKSVLNEEPQTDFNELLRHAHKKQLIDNPEQIIKVKELLDSGAEPTLEQVHTVLFFLESIL